MLRTNLPSYKYDHLAREADTIFGFLPSFGIVYWITYLIYLPSLRKMDWPAKLVFQRSGKPFVKLFNFDAVESMEILRECQKVNLDDIIIVRGEGDGGDFSVWRKSYLLQISPYFRSFVERWNSKDQPHLTPEIKLENVSLEVFRNLLELSWTGVLEIGVGTDFATIICAANFLEMTDLSQRFSKLIRDEIRNCNASVILWCYLTPEECHGYLGLIEEAFPFLKAKFDGILETCSEQLMEATEKQWLDILSDPGLFLISEDLLFRTISRWVSVDPLKRSDDFKAMASYIRGGCLSEDILTEFRAERSVAPVVRMFAASVSASSESQPRTIEALAFFSRDGNGGCEMLCFDPLVRSAESVSIPIKFDTSASIYRPCRTSTANVIYMFHSYSLCAIDPVPNIGIPDVALAHIPPLGNGERTGGKILASMCGKAYLDGFLYVAFRTFYGSPVFFKVDCSDISPSNVSKFYVPDHFQAEINYGRLGFVLIGGAGKLHIFTETRHGTYDPNSVFPSEAWSHGLDRPPYQGSPKSCCVGPDGMIYIAVRGSTRLWVFNAATSGFIATAKCKDTIREVLNVEDTIVCVVVSKQSDNFATRVYNHVADLWTEARETTVDSYDFWDPLPVRLLASSFKLFPRNSAK